MTDSKSYESRLGRAAARQFKKLPSEEQSQVRAALVKTCITLARPGARGGKSLKKIRGRHDRFYRLRAGDLRVMFELHETDRVVLVQGIVNRRDLEKWLCGN